MNDIINIKELKQHILSRYFLFYSISCRCWSYNGDLAVRWPESVANLGDSGIGYWLLSNWFLRVCSWWYRCFAPTLLFPWAANRHWQPGFIIGWAAQNINTGFIGGMVGGILVGIVVNLCKKYIHLPKVIESLKGMLVIPFPQLQYPGLLMYAVIQGPIIWLMAQLTGFLQSLSSGL